MRKYWILLVLIVIIAYGCKQRAVTQPEAEQMDKQKEISQTQKGKGTIPEQQVASIDSEDISSKYMKGEKGIFNDILFDFDKYNVKEGYKSTLQSVSSWMMKNSGARLSIEGHCDERGTNEYNLALGDRRAKAVKDYLSSLGVPSAKIDMLSYGEEKPLCTKQQEECWSKNRRAHFVILKAR